MPIPSDEDMKRISRTVTYVERLQRSAPVAPSQQQFVAPIVQLIRVTGDAAVSGRYPAIVQDYDADTDTWSDLTDADCYAIDPDGGTLAAGIYLARRWGEYNSLPVFTPTEQGLNAASVPDVSAIISGIVNLSDQYLGAGQKAVDEIAIASTAGTVNAADPVLRAFAHTVSAGTRYIIAIERDATPYAAQAPLSAIRFIAFCDADRLPDSESDTWIQASGETASEVSQATLSFHVRGAGADNGFVLSADDYASVGTYSTNANFTAFSAGTIMAGLGFVYGDGGTNYPGITSASAVFVAPITVRGGIVTSATSLTDPNADRIPFWDDSAGSVAWLEVGSGLSISGTTLTATGSYTDSDAEAAIVALLTATSTISWSNSPGASITADIIDASVTNAKLMDMGAWTIKGNATSSTATPQDITISLLTEEASPASGDWLLAEISTGELRKVNVSNLPSGTPSAHATSHENGGSDEIETASLGTSETDTTLVLAPDGAGGVEWRAESGGSGSIHYSAVSGFRLTLTSATPVTSGDVTGAGTLYMAVHTADHLLIPNTGATDFDVSSPGQLSLSLTLTSGKNYDVFCWNNAGTPTLTLSSAWTNDTTRADALGTLKGITVNNGSIGSMGAKNGVWLGTIRASGSNTTEDSTSKRYVWNAFNRVARPIKAVETTDSWTYNSATYREVNGGSTEGTSRVGVVLGASCECVTAFASVLVNGSGTNAGPGIGVDSATNVAGIYLTVNTVATNPALCRYSGYPGIGYRTIRWLESSGSGLTVNFYGDAGTTIIQSGMSGEVWG